MIRLLILPLLLIPADAHAAGLADVSATTIAYSKWVFVLVGIWLTFKAVSRASSGEPVGPVLKLAIAAAVVPSLVFSFLSVVGIGSIQASSIAAAGRSYTEYMLCQVGLLTSAILPRMGWYNLLLVGVIFGSLAAVFLKATGEIDERYMTRMLKGYFVPAAFIVVIFNPWYQQGSTNNAQQLIQDIKAHSQANSQNDNLQLPGPMPTSSTLLPTVASKTVSMLPIAPSMAKVPVVLSSINSAMDELVASVTDAISAKGFSRYGMAGVQGMLNNLQGSLPSWINPDLKRRLLLFTDTCVVTQIQSRLKSDPAFANGWATDPQKMAATYDPFSKSNLFYYNHTGNRACSLMIVGGYSWDNSMNGGVVPGKQYPLGIRDEILANAALNDPRIRADYPSMKTVQDAWSLMPEIKQHYSDWPGMVLSIFDNAVLASYERSNNAATVMAGQQSNSSALSNLGTEIETRFYQLSGSAKQAGSVQQVNLEMPIWMGSLQMILLALFPLVFLLSLIPGQAGSLGYYFMTLLWSKSYIIAWALISNFDHWQSTALSYDGSTTSAADKLAMVHAIQQLQMWSPLLMALVLFGPRVAAHSMAKGAGAA